ncbi:hypothetical protein VOLCADRAFT_108495 [Volvox carteri f. nagariensis]|uniref:Vacuolar protein sorting protein 11 C-terminal domain-containing protein n=1 Tax=Volvox carteri f. nagariensis TaxID=3068 RepID=D8UKG1_VOLCA|nr:uncharacterized protein VOLCADRAFT_108495 [Volvox carteri f. nagariensis]EFJ39770.1 hypothetical protein VOLCADRAFT_108495 [Volvox carteri f. nagariensis]|eukprot:XP_002959147.1 hypothetical protein VOLCADRAFT_108495 [Volvox carteri f. nagariensis]
MSCGDHPGLISAVLKYGDASRGGDPVLWSEVLEYFVTQHDSNPPTSDCSAQILQPRLFQNSRCSASGGPLELPVVHFLCGHSYNLRQLGDNDRECPLCGPDQRRVIEIRNSMQGASLQPERFFAELRQSADGFAVVAEHFGRGLMNVTPVAAATAAPAGVPGGPVVQSSTVEYNPGQYSTVYLLVV